MTDPGTGSTPAAGDATGDVTVGTAARLLRVWRGDKTGGGLTDFAVAVNEGEVVLDVLHRLQATEAGDLAIRWNCKAGKCGAAAPRSTADRCCCA